MKRLLIPILICFCSTSILAQEVDSRTKASVYACIKKNDTLHIKQAEVSIADWLGYIYVRFQDDAFNDDNETYNDVKQNLPLEIDSSCKFIYDLYLRTWNNEWEMTNKPKWYRETLGVFPLCLYKDELKDYKRIKLHLDMPVTGLSFDQVYGYLNWQAEKLDSFLSEDETYRHVVDLIPISLYDQLIQENIAGLRAAKNKDGALAVIGDSVNIKGCQLFNFKGSANCAATEARIETYGTSEGPVSVYSYNPDLNGYYNLLGNVAEMAYEEGFAIGGNYEMYATEITQNKPLNYSEPNKLIGFRYLVKLVKN